MMFKGFGAGAIDFFNELEQNNAREWWHANKARYEREIRELLEHLLADLADEFGEAKVFRPNRDTRFSRDKTPYKPIDSPVTRVRSRYPCAFVPGILQGTHTPRRNARAG